MRFDGFDMLGDEANQMLNAFGVMMWCIAGNSAEVVQGEYAFFAALRIHLQGSRDIVATSTPMVVNWTSLQAGQSGDAVTLTQAQHRFKNFTSKDMQSFLSDPSHWIEHGTLEPGDMLYVPVGAMLASRTKANHAIGLKVGVAVPSDSSSANCLDNLERLSKEWYKGTMTEHLAKMFQIGVKVHHSMSSASGTVTSSGTA